MKMEYKDLRRLTDALLNERNAYLDEWKKVSRVVHPSSYSAILALDKAKLDMYKYCEPAAQCCQTLASGHSQLITPSNALWFNIGAPAKGKSKTSDEVQRWSSESSFGLWQAFCQSNLQAALAKGYLDRCAIGHEAIHVKIKEDNGQFVFTHIPAGTFSFARAEDGEVDTFVREFDLTPNEAVAYYGEENLGEALKKSYRKLEDRYTKTYRFYHIVLRNPQGQKGLINRAIEERQFSEYVFADCDKKIIAFNGLVEFPFMVSSFLAWGENRFGVSPAQIAWTSIKQYEDTMDILNQLGRKALAPAVLIPDGMAGMVDMRPGSQTPVPEEYLGSNYPRELTPQARYDIGLKLAELHEKNIKLAYFYDIVRPLAGLTQEMTAEEVRLRVQENTTNFVHSFSQFNSDLLPFIATCYSLLYRWAYRNDKLGKDGVLPQIPSSLYGTVLNQTADGKDFHFEKFNINLTSRMAIALKEVSNQQDAQALNYLAQTAEQLQMPELIDNVNVDKAVRGYWASVNASTDSLRTELEVEQIRKQRAQAQQEQAMMQQALTASEAARNVAPMMQQAQ